MKTPFIDTFFNIFFINIDSPSPEEDLILSNVLIRGEPNFDDKYVEKSVQLVIGSSFRNDLLQNPYFSQYLLLSPRQCSISKSKGNNHPSFVKVLTQNWHSTTKVMLMQVTKCQSRWTRHWNILWKDF